MVDAALFTQATGQGHDWIAARVPHQGRMCLLDAVQAASPQAIVCTAHSHRAPDHPLAHAGRLGAACGIEYAAQVMALHGALKAAAHGSTRPTRGLLVSVRGVQWQVARLDAVAGPLTIHAECLADQPGGSLYQFSLHDGPHLLLQGRAVVMLDATGAKP